MVTEQDVKVMSCFNVLGPDIERKCLQIAKEATTKFSSEGNGKSYNNAK